MDQKTRHRIIVTKADFTINIPNDNFKTIDGKKCIVCKHCNGFGFLIYVSQKSNNDPEPIQDRDPCFECGGIGYRELTWTENIIHAGEGNDKNI